MADTKDLKSFDPKDHKGSTPFSGTTFKAGDRVKMKYFGGYATGEVTIVSELGVKIIFDGDFDLDYWYYSAKDLELIK